MKPLTPTDLWWRVGIGVALMVVSLLLYKQAVSGLIFALGVGWIAWAVIRGVLQVRKAEAIQRARRSGAELPSPSSRSRGSATKEKPLISFKLGAIIVGVAILLLLLLQAWTDAEDKRLGKSIERACVDAALRQGVEVTVTDRQPYVEDDRYPKQDVYKAEAEVSNGTRTYLVKMHCTVDYSSESKENVDSVNLFFE